MDISNKNTSYIFHNENLHVKIAELYNDYHE